MLAGLAMLVAFWPTLESMHGVWTRITYSHGYLVAPVVAWLVWRRRDALTAGHDGSELALASLVALSSLWFVAVVTNVQVIHQGLLPVILLLWTAAVAGWPAARRLLPAAAIFLFAVPFWEVFTRPLQLMTIAMSSAGVRLLRIPADIAGEYIAIPSGTFRVADSCSGLRFFIVGLLLGTLYAHLFSSRWRTRLQIMATAVGLALVSNWIRVLGLVVIGHATEMQWEHLEDHGFYGWVVFVAIFSLFFPLAGYLVKREERRGGGPDGAGSGEVGGRPDRADEAPGAEGGASPPPSPGSVRRRVILATTLAAAGPLAFFGLRAAPVAGVEELREPEVDGGWARAEEPAVAPLGWQPAYPEADLRSEAVWTDGSARVYRLELLYRNQAQGRELVGADSRIAPSGDVAAEEVLWLPEEDVWVREAFVRTPEGIVVVWYWYRIGGMKAVLPAKAKALELWGFLRRRPSAALVTLAAACVSDRCQAERTGLRAFVGGVPAASLAEDGSDPGS